MKRNVIRKNTTLGGISIERQIEIPDYDMTLQKLSTMTPYLEGRKYVYEDANSSSDLSNYKIYDVQEWIDNPNKEKVELEDGYYAIHPIGEDYYNYAAICNVTKQIDSSYEIRLVDIKPYVHEDIVKVPILNDYNNPESFLVADINSNPTSELNDFTSQFRDDSIYKKICNNISKITGINCNSSSNIEEENPIIKGCILVDLHLDVDIK